MGAAGGFGGTESFIPRGSHSREYLAVGFHFAHPGRSRRAAQNSGRLHTGRSILSRGELRAGGFFCWMRLHGIIAVTIGGDGVYAACGRAGVGETKIQSTALTCFPGPAGIGLIARTIPHHHLMLQCTGVEDSTSCADPQEPHKPSRFRLEFMPGAGRLKEKSLRKYTKILSR
jgi:hypothetical protein